MHTVGIGKQNYESLIMSDCFYVDKTYFYKTMVGVSGRCYTYYQTKKIWKNIKYEYAEFFFQINI